MLSRFTNKLIKPVKNFTFDKSVLKGTLTMAQQTKLANYAMRNSFYSLSGMNNSTNGIFCQSLARNYSQEQIEKDRQYASENQAYTHKIEALKNFLEQNETSTTAPLGLDPMVIISECCIDLAFEQFVLCVQNLRTMRLVLLRESTNLDSIVNIGKDSFDGVTEEAAKQNGVDYIPPIQVEVSDSEKLDQYVDLCV